MLAGGATWALFALAYGAAFSGGTLYLAGADGVLRRLSSLPTAQSTAPLPLTDVVTGQGTFWGLDGEPNRVHTDAADRARHVSAIKQAGKPRCGGRRLVVSPHRSRAGAGHDRPRGSGSGRR